MIISVLTAELGVTLSDAQAQLFEKYMDMLLDWNSRMNLTAVTQPEDIAVKHFADSLTVLKYMDGVENAIDVGTGAGFPGLPIKIMRPDLDMTLLDSLNKRILFLNAVIDELGLDGVRAVHARAEEINRNKSSMVYDICFARAVARLSELARYCLPFLRPGGRFLAMKGPDIGEEIAESEKMLKRFGGEVVDVDSFTLAGMGRSVVVIKKI